MTDYKYIFNNQGEKYHQFVSGEDYEDNLMAAILSIDDLTGKDIIEFGAGTGRLSFKLSRYVRSLTAFDKSCNILTIAKRLMDKQGIKNIQFRQADSLFLPGLDKEYDTAIQAWSFLVIIAFSEKKWIVDSLLIAQ